MNKYSYIALLIAAVLGAVIYSLFQPSPSEGPQTGEELRLEEQIKNSKRILDSLTKEIKKKDSSARIDSINIEQFKEKININQQHINWLRTEAKKFNKEQRAEFFEDRYNSSDRDTIDTKIIDELIIKDGLVVKCSLLDSSILSFQHRDSTLTSIIKDYKLKEASYDSILSNKDNIITLSKQDNKELKKSLRKERIKKGLFKITSIAGGVAVIALLL